MMSKTVRITGASGGIGKELADRFAKDGYDLVLVARSEDKLVDLAREYREKYRVQTTYIAKDIALPGVAEEIYRELKEKGITVDFLVNNAGFGLYGEFLETQLEQETNMININIKALTAMTKVFVGQVADIGYREFLRCKTLIITGGAQQVHGVLAAVAASQAHDKCGQIRTS
ncbi:MAG: short-chain dehydrogenase [Paenibacillus sp.]|jgi:short-subunit dehydrogenase|nr:short-chain dehydrogenase [Paenibacillus sp.]